MITKIQGVYRITTSTNQDLIYSLIRAVEPTRIDYINEVYTLDRVEFYEREVINTSSVKIIKRYFQIIDSLGMVKYFYTY